MSCVSRIVLTSNIGASLLRVVHGNLDVNQTNNLAKLRGGICRSHIKPSSSTDRQDSLRS